jgi:hypothetical protein
MAFQPMPLSRKPAPFDHPEWIFELKYDGFRSLAVIQNGRCQLISRNGHPFNSFDSLRKSLTVLHDRKTVARWRDCLSRQAWKAAIQRLAFFIGGSHASLRSTS